MTFIFDEDSANTAVAEERGYQDWMKEQKNFILRMSSTERKQKAWSDLNPKLAIEGLSKEDLEMPW